MSVDDTKPVKDDLFTLQDIDAATLVFPANVSHLMPAYGKIPDEFKRSSGTKWNDLFSKWFFGGVKGLRFVRKPGVDDATAEKALRQIRCVMGSYEPKHEHKEAACAYMLSRFFDDYTLDDSGRIDRGHYVEQTVKAS